MVMHFFFLNAVPTIILNTNLDAILGVLRWSFVWRSIDASSALDRRISLLFRCCFIVAANGGSHFIANVSSDFQFFFLLQFSLVKICTLADWFLPSH